MTSAGLALGCTPANAGRKSASASLVKRPCFPGFWPHRPRGKRCFRKRIASFLDTCAPALRRSSAPCMSSSPVLPVLAFHSDAHRQMPGERAPPLTDPCPGRSNAQNNSKLWLPRRTGTWIFKITKSVALSCAGSKKNASNQILPCPAHTILTEARRDRYM